MKKAGILLYAAAAAVFAAAVLLVCALVPSAMAEAWALLSAGAFSMLFIALCAGFLAELSAGRPGPGRAVLALLAGAAAFWQLAFSFGQGPLRALAASPLFGLIPLALTGVYVWLNRRGGFLRAFGAALLALGAALGASYIALKLSGSPLPGAAEDAVALSLRGRAPAVWLSQYLALSCCGGALGVRVRERAALQRRLEDLSAREAMLAESYERMARGIKDTSVLRHDWKNQIAALRLLAKMGDMERLRGALERLDTRLARLSLREFSGNFPVNVLLQNAAARCLEAGVTFNALAPLPEELAMDTADLCSLLLNMLDNAVAAAAQAEGRREVEVSLRLAQGFLAIKCENSCPAASALPQEGATESEPEGDGRCPGLRSMRLTAKKYGGILDISCENGRFTVQTALNLK